MDPLSLLVSTGGIAALILQGVSSQVKRKDPNALGAIDLTLAAIAAVIVSLLRSGNVVIATDFGLIMAQGTWTIPLVRAALVAAAILPALCWNRARALNQWQSSRLVAVAAGAAMGLWAATQVRILNPVDPLPLQFHVYDVWWPPLVIWFTLCSAGCMLALVGLRGARYCIAMTAALVVPVSMFVLAWPTLLDRAAVMNPWWISLEWVSLLIASLAAARWRTAEDGRGRWSRVLLTIGGAAAATIVFRFVPMPGSARAALGAAPLAIITARLLRAIVLCKRDADAKRRPNRLHAVCVSLSLPIGKRQSVKLTWSACGGPEAASASGAAASPSVISIASRRPSASLIPVSFRANRSIRMSLMSSLSTSSHRHVHTFSLSSA